MPKALAAALALAATAAAAQDGGGPGALFQAADLVDRCGGQRVIYAPAGAASEDQLRAAGETLLSRIDAGPFKPAQAKVADGAIALSIAIPIERDWAALATSARLGFHDVLEIAAPGTMTPGPGELVRAGSAAGDGAYRLAATPVLSGVDLAAAQPTVDQSGRPSIAFRFTPEGGAAFGAYTAANIGKPFAIVVDGTVLSAPVIQSPITGGRGIITGSFTVQEAEMLALRLDGGPLPIDLTLSSVEQLPRTAACDS